MKNRLGNLKTLIYVLFFGASVMMPFLSVKATSLLPSVKLSSSNGVSELVNAVNSESSKYLDEFEFWSFTFTSTNGVVISIDTITYAGLSEADKQSLMGVTLTSIKNSSLVKVDETRLYNFVCSQDTSTSMIVRQLVEDANTDYYSAYSVIKPWTGSVGVGLALLSLAMFVGMTISFLLDMFYITVPLFSCLITSDETKRPKIITPEAFKTYLECNKTDHKGDIVICYIKKIWWHFAIVSVCVLYLASGRIWNLVADAVDTLKGVL